MKTMQKFLAFFWIIMIILYNGCSERKAKEEDTKGLSLKYATIGKIERLDQAIDQLIPRDSEIEILSNGFEWSEGPVWIPEGNYLLFSDIPRNSVFKWSASDSIELYLKPSGYTGEQGRGGEEGSNGLILNPQGKLVLCQHGDRRVAGMNAMLSEPAPDFITLAGDFEGKRLNSPNDAVYHSNGDLYFTDPPYGLENGENDPEKELDFQGVYVLKKDGTLVLLTSELSRPNGIGLSPDEKTLYVANSDPERAIWMAFDVLAEGILGEGRVFYNVTELTSQEKGLPDGLKVHSSGALFATGPGGVFIFNPDGKHLGTIKTTEATANCAFDETESNLYITADMYLQRVRLK